MRTSSPHPESRRARTRMALESALTVLALETSYDEIRVDDIVAASGVGRSTFYEHFSGKDALLEATLHGALAVLAGVCNGDTSVQSLEQLLVHFWGKRHQACRLFQGSAQGAIRDQLAAQVERGLARRAGDRMRLPSRLAARTLADAVFSPVVAWLAEEASCSAADFAAALVKVSTATRIGLVAACND